MGSLHIKSSNNLSSNVSRVVGISRRRWNRRATAQAQSITMVKSRKVDQWQGRNGERYLDRHDVRQLDPGPLEQSTVAHKHLGRHSQGCSVGCRRSPRRVERRHTSPHNTPDEGTCLLTFRPSFSMRVARGRVLKASWKASYTTRPGLTSGGFPGVLGATGVLYFRSTSLMNPCPPQNPPKGCQSVVEKRETSGRGGGVVQTFQSPTRHNSHKPLTLTPPSPLPHPYLVLTALLVVATVENDGPWVQQRKQKQADAYLDAVATTIHKVPVEQVLQAAM